MRRRSAEEEGFTLIELMVVCAILVILAVVVIPNFMSETKKSKAKSEVGSVFGEFAVRQEQYKLENGVYLAATICPATTTIVGTDPATCVAGVWAPLRVHISNDKLICTYVITVGLTTGTNNPGGFTFTSPSGGWFYVTATCDSDNSPTLNSTYFISSISSKIQVKNEGN